MISNIKQGFFRITKGKELTDVFFLDKENVFVLSSKIGKLTGEELEETIMDINNDYAEFVDKKVMLTKIVSKTDIVNATFIYTEINEGNIKGVLEEVIHTEDILGKVKTFSDSYIIKEVEGLKRI